MSHAGDPRAGLSLTGRFRDHVKDLAVSDSRNPEVQNRFGRLRRLGSVGPLVSFSGNEADPLFHNTGSGFVDIGSTLGIARTEDGRGFALVDLDQDGALDVVLHNHFRNPIVAMLNRAAGGNRWLRLRLRGTKSNRFGIGARVTVNGRVQELACGTGYLSGNAPELHFGLGKAESADVSVRWPSGQVDEYKGFAANRVVTLVEGDPKGIRVEVLRKLEPPAATPPPTVPPEPDARKVAAELDPAGAEAPRLVVFFSLDCLACVAELREAEGHERRAAAAGARILWVSTDADFGQVQQEFALNKSAVKPLRARDLPGGLQVPSVYLVRPAGVEKFTGRHAMTAALEAAAVR